jgi:HlyD family secretion protein
MSESQVAPDARSSWKPVEPQQSAASGDKPARQKQQPSTKPKERKATIWLKDGQFVRPVEVKAGFTDGTRTAISSDQIHEGVEVVTGEVTQTADTTQKNPFIPQMPSRR